MSKTKKTYAAQEKKRNQALNNVTQSQKPENQNQTHNVKKEGIAPINNKY